MIRMLYCTAFFKAKYFVILLFLLFVWFISREGISLEVIFPWEIFTGGNFLGVVIFKGGGIFLGSNFLGGGNFLDTLAYFSKLNYIEPASQLNRSKCRISARGPALWNEFLTDSEKEIENISLFKSKVKSELLSNENEVIFFL